MTERLIRYSQSRFPALRLWRAPSWPVGEASLGGRAAEWCSGQPGHPTSYALLGVHDGPDTAGHAHVGEVFNAALIGRADDVLFGLPVEYREAVGDVLAIRRNLSPSLAAHGRAGSSVVAFRAMTIFVRDLTDELWSSNDDALWQTWRLAFDAAQFDGGLTQAKRKLPRLIDEHRAGPFPESIEKGINYGEIEPVLVGADIYGWAIRVAAGEMLDRAGRLALGDTRNELRRSLQEFPVDARPYYQTLVELASAALSAASAS
ncbi:MAG: hypothetical protein GY720_18795 [bacterium]|nr:hypothetical protein [bacterium]